MEQVFYTIRGVLGDGGTDAREPRKGEQHDGEPPAACHRRLQVLRGEDDLLRSRLLVPVHSGDQEQNSK